MIIVRIGTIARITGWVAFMLVIGGLWLLGQ